MKTTKQSTFSATLRTTILLASLGGLLVVNAESVMMEESSMPPTMQVLRDFVRLQPRL